jgi:hypothetical protein
VRSSGNNLGISIVPAISLYATIAAVNTTNKTAKKTEHAEESSNESEQKVLNTQQNLLFAKCYFKV